MYLVDSHCHLDRLDLTIYGGELENALAHAKKQGVGHMLCACITLEDFPRVLEIAKIYPHISASVGLHPNDLVDKEPTAEDIMILARDEKVVAIGETGLDYFRTESDADWQRDRFRQHIRAAKEIGKPLIVHTRQAQEDTIQILKEERAESIGGVMHCFTEDWDMASQALDLNFYISISGIVTFKNAKQIQDVAKLVPLNRLLVETDSPYLAPNPFRGKSNEPAYVRNVAEFVAHLREMDVEDLARKTTENFFELFNTAVR